MDPIFSELRSILHAPIISFPHVEALLDGARPEVWDYARPLLDRLQQGNVWAPLDDVHDADAALEWSDDILIASDRAQVNKDDSMGMAHGIILGEYTRVVWRADVRRSLHGWMLHKVRQALLSFEVLDDTLAPESQALERWCAGLLPSSALQMVRRDLTQRWPQMSLDAHLEAAPVAQPPTAEDAREAMMAWGRMGAPSRQGTLSEEHMSAQLHVLRQQWIIWLMLHALDTSKTPLIDVFVELLGMFHHVEVLTQPLRWQEHPSRILIFVQGMMGEVLRNDLSILGSVRRRVEALRQELALWLNTHAL